MEQQKTILIVEDEKSLASALEIKLGLIGFRVLIASDGEECMQIALREHPDLVLMDIVMPKMDGLTAIKKLREDEWGKTVPIIILTNSSNPQDMSEVTKNSVNAYLVKSDWKLEDVVEKVRKTLEQ